MPLWARGNTMRHYKNPFNQGLGSKLSDELRGILYHCDHCVWSRGLNNEYGKDGLHNEGNCVKPCKVGCKAYQVHDLRYKKAP